MSYASQTGEYEDRFDEEPRQTWWRDEGDVDGYGAHEARHPSEPHNEHTSVREAPRGMNGPAHPLPTVRRSQIDYDQYLESPTAKFKIFSAEANRKRRKSVLRIIVIGAIVLAVILWVMFGRP